MHVLHFDYEAVMNMTLREFFNWLSRAQTLALGDFNILKFRQESKEQTE